MRRVVYYLFAAVVKNIVCSDHELNVYMNGTDPASRQLPEFAKKHPILIGILTTSAGGLVEIRESVTLNSDEFCNPYHIDLLTHADGERVPERLVHAKGIAALGYFVVTHDVSKYTNADVFNGIGKKTLVVGRFSTAAQNLGGTDLRREMKGLTAKFFTTEGNLHFVMLNVPIFLHKDALVFTHVLQCY